MQTITCVLRDHASGYPDPLIYTVKVADPTNFDAVEIAVMKERRKDTGENPADMCLELLFAFPGDIPLIADWRE